jgi:CheY-like chemotaxis protein
VHQIQCVLVVEDEPIVRFFIADQLRDQGYAVVEAETGEKAIALLSEADHLPIIAVFTDIELSGRLSGWDVADAYRQAYSQIRIIYTSGHSQDTRRRVSRSTFLAKPYLPTDVFDALLAPIEQRPVDRSEGATRTSKAVRLQRRNACEGPPSR